MKIKIEEEGHGMSSAIRNISRERTGGVHPEIRRGILCGALSLLRSKGLQLRTRERAAPTNKTLVALEVDSVE